MNTGRYEISVDLTFNDGTPHEFSASTFEPWGDEGQPNFLYCVANRMGYLMRAIQASGTTTSIDNKEIFKAFKDAWTK